MRKLHILRLKRSQSGWTNKKLNACTSYNIIIPFQFGREISMESAENCILKHLNIKFSWGGPLPPDLPRRLAPSVKIQCLQHPWQWPPILRSQLSASKLSDNPIHPALTTHIQIIIINNIVALTENVEVGCPRHPGATTIGNHLQDEDRTDGWQNLTTQPWAPMPSRRTSEPRWLGEKGSWLVSQSPESPTSEGTQRPPNCSGPS